MTRPARKAGTAGWILATMVTPFGLSMFFANVHLAWWYYQMGARGTPHVGPPPLDIVIQAVMRTAWAGLWCTVLVWWLIKRKHHSFAELFGTQTTSLAKDAALGGTLGALWVLIYGLARWPRFEAMFAFNAAKLASLPTSLSAGVCEEFLFRGFVILLIREAGGGKKWQVFWSSLAFGLAHFHWGPIGMLSTALLGLSLGGVTLWRRGSVWAAVLAHTIINACIEPGLMNKVLSLYAQR